MVEAVSEFKREEFEGEEGEGDGGREGGGIGDVYGEVEFVAKCDVGGAWGNGIEGLHNHILWQNYFSYLSTWNPVM